MALLWHNKMSSSIQAASMDRLPPDVLSNNIFIRLPAKLLAQMRCVSKPWNDLLSRPSFVKTHLYYSMNNNEEIILVFYDLFRFDYKPFTAHPTRYPNQELTSLIKTPVVEPDSIFNFGGHGCYIIGSVNGLICFYKESDPPHNVYIWNPSLSVVLTLPPFDMPSTDTKEHFDIFYRFGYDPQTDDYKVVKLISHLKPPPDFNESPFYALFGTISYVVKEWLPVEVYSMRKGFWEPVTQKVPSNVGRIDNNDEVCWDGYDGHVHWVCKLGETGNQKTILAYDLDLETFNEISLPAHTNDNIHRYYVLGILGGKLCVMFNVTDGDSEVWILDKYPMAESWVKHHKFSLFGNIDQFGFTLHNEFIFSAYNRLYFYDPIAEKVKLSDIPARILGSAKIVQYIDSLVWIVPSRSEINCCSISSLQI